ncbi:hypothetical protein C8R47DRAFT_1229111 [Mycena vitilis]|nr:hypothetical protein C8R47DRAFT_1229111 [Mycena vitilis]
MARLSRRMIPTRYTMILLGKLNVADAALNLLMAQTTATGRNTTIIMTPVEIRSGFWRDVEKGLDVLFEKNGNDRSSREWLEWEKQIIDEDNCRYNRSGAETSARSQEDIDVATRPRGAGNESDEEDEVPEDRDISVDGLGDLAATTAGPVSR